MLQMVQSVCNVRNGWSRLATAAISPAPLKPVSHYDPYYTIFTQQNKNHLVTKDALMPVAMASLLPLGKKQENAM